MHLLNRFFFLCGGLFLFLFLLGNTLLATVRVRVGGSEESDSHDHTTSCSDTNYVNASEATIVNVTVEVTVNTINLLFLFGF